MAEANDILQQAKKVWANLGGSQKAAAVGVTVLVFAGILAGAFLGGSEDYKQLIANVPAKELSGVVSQLDDAGITDYRIIDGGAIHVNSDVYEQARTVLYKAGTLPGSFAEEDSSSGMFGSGGALSREDRAHQRTLETEKRLQKAITAQFPDVKRAKVTITSSQKKYWRGASEPAKASVIITPNGNHHDISNGLVSTIAYMVASGVQSLSADDVTVATNTGMVLKNAKGGKDTASVDSQLSQKASLEANLVMKAQSRLDQAFGPGRVLVAVDTTLDWTRINKTEKKFDIEGKVVREKTTQESKKPLGSASNGGAPGTNQNNNGREGNKALIATDTTKKESNDYGHLTTTEIRLGGDIKRMTASVIVAEELKAQAEEIKNVVAGAIGLDIRRGDEITVTSAKIEVTTTAPTESGDEGFNISPMISFWIEKGTYILLGLLFIFFALRTVKKAQADLRSVLEASMEEENKEEVVQPLTLEESVLETATADTDLAGRSLRRWLYEGATANAGAEE